MPIFNTEYKSYNPTFIYEYDFRNKTLAWVQADGWTFPEWTDWVAFDSNWMYKSAMWAKQTLYVIGSSILQNANKVTLTDHQNKWYWDIDCILWFTWSTNERISYIYYWNGRSVYNVNWINKRDSYSTLANWYYTQIIEVDFTISKITFTCWSNIQTFDMSASDITALRTATGINCSTCKSQSNYIPDISITVEY